MLFNTEMLSAVGSTAGARQRPKLAQYIAAALIIVVLSIGYLSLSQSGGAGAASARLGVRRFVAGVVPVLPDPMCALHSKLCLLPGLGIMMSTMLRLSSDSRLLVYAMTRQCLGPAHADQCSCLINAPALQVCSCANLQSLHTLHGSAKWLRKHAVSKFSRTTWKTRDMECRCATCRRAALLAAARLSAIGRLSRHGGFHTTYVRPFLITACSEGSTAHSPHVLAQPG